MLKQYRLRSYATWRMEWSAQLIGNPEFSSLGASLIAHLDGLGVVRVITESHYIDSDYTSAFSHYYSHMFSPPSRFCQRDLFFTQEFKSIRGVRRKAVRESFAGFMVIWPTSPPVVGRTALACPLDGAYPSDLITADYKVHVAGEELTIRSAMVASKDHGVAVCATISTWLATDLMHRRHGLRTTSSTEITLLATGRDPRWGRPLPQLGQGLDREQICRALVELGYGPRIYHYDGVNGETPNWIGVLSGHLPAGIPVIILCKVVYEQSSARGDTRERPAEHAVVAVGLRYAPLSGDDALKDGPGTRTFARTTTEVFIHDDRFGAFGAVVPKYEWSNNRKRWSPQLAAERVNFPTLGSPGVNPATPGMSRINEWIVETLIVPLPAAVILPSQNAHQRGSAYLKRAFARLRAENSNLDEYRGPFRTTLFESTEIKRRTLEWEGEFPHAARAIREMALPRWVWVTEAYPSDARVPGDGEPLARVLMDSSELPFSGDDIILAVQFFDQFIPGRRAGR